MIIHCGRISLYRSLQTQGEYGWCGTCIASASKPGQEGYCGIDARNDNSEAVQVQPFSNWGFCNKHCAIQDPLTNILQVPRITFKQRFVPTVS